eukprot:scaffold5897_cov188-Skeletonema_dohrnii-CCMP3373.AAC.2
MTKKAAAAESSAAEAATLRFQDSQRLRKEAAAAVINSTTSTSKTSVSAAVAAACNPTLAKNMREATATAKRQRHPQLTALMKKTVEPDFYYCSKPTNEGARRALEAKDEPPNRAID